MTGYQFFAVAAPLIAAGVAAGTGVIALKVFTKPRRVSQAELEAAGATDLDNLRKDFRNSVIQEATSLAERIIERADHLPGAIDIPKERAGAK